VGQRGIVRYPITHRSSLGYAWAVAGSCRARYYAADDPRHSYAYHMTDPRKSQLVGGGKLGSSRFNEYGYPHLR
jgi:hypothetical protein